MRLRSRPGVVNTPRRAPGELTVTASRTAFALTCLPLSLQRWRPRTSMHRAIDLRLATLDEVNGAWRSGWDALPAPRRRPNSRPRPHPLAAEACDIRGLFEPAPSANQSSPGRRPTIHCRSRPQQSGRQLSSSRLVPCDGAIGPGTSARRRGDRPMARSVRRPRQRAAAPPACFSEMGDKPSQAAPVPNSPDQPSRRWQAETRLLPAHVASQRAHAQGTDKSEAVGACPPPQCPPAYRLTHRHFRSLKWSC